MTHKKHDADWGLEHIDARNDERVRHDHDPIVKREQDEQGGTDGPLTRNRVDCL